MNDETITAVSDTSPQPSGGSETGRRALLARAIGAATLAGGALASGRVAAQTATPTPTPTPTSTASPSPTPSPTSTAGSSGDYLNVALNVLYLKANFYSFATTGAAIASTDQTGRTTLGAQGAATGGAQVPFSDPVIGNLAREIAGEALANLRYLRTFLATLAVAQPAIDLTPAGAFTTAMRAAGVTAAGATFNPYADDDSFLLAAFLLADWPIGIYKSVGPVSGSVSILEALGGLVGTESYHSAAIRTIITRRGNLVAQTEQISAYRDALDGAPAQALVTGYAPDDDQGVAPIGTASNIVPVNPNAIAYSRTYDRILNIMYLKNATATSGGFFPAGVNGTFKTSGAAVASA